MELQNRTDLVFFFNAVRKLASEMRDASKDFFSFIVFSFLFIFNKMISL